MTSYTVADLLDFIGEFVQKESGTPNRKLNLMFLNQGVREIWRGAGGRAMKWDNVAVTGALTITNNEAPLPIDLLEVESVWWGGWELIRRDAMQLDYLESDWRNSTVEIPDSYAMDGRRLLLNGVTGTAAGSLVVHGYGLGADFSDDPTEDNPLDEIAGADQLLPAYFTIWRLPITRAKAESNDPVIVRAAMEESQLRRDTRLEYKELWLRGLPDAVDQVMRRRGRTYTGR